jgi:hypothetical protein
MMVMTLIQLAQPTQLAAIANLNVESYHEYATHLSADQWTTLQGNLRAVEQLAQRATFLVALFADELAGSVAYCPPFRLSGSRLTRTIDGKTLQLSAPIGLLGCSTGM